MVLKTYAMLGASTLVLGLFMPASAQTQTLPKPPEQESGNDPVAQSTPSTQNLETSEDSEAASSEEIVVTGTRASLTRAAEIKRNADQVVEAIVADDIGKFPDTTVASALQRVPGVQVVNGFNNEIVSPLIRGIGDILTTLDGREIFTGVGRGFAFQDIPAEALAGVNVYKSNSADLIEGGVAGAIDMRLQKPFNFDDGLTVASNLRGLYGKEVDHLNYTAGLLASYRMDTVIGEMGLLIDGSYSDQRFSRPITINCDPRSATGQIPGGDGVVLPNCVAGLLDYGDYERPQANAAFQWRPTSELELYADALYAGYRSKFSSYFVVSSIFDADSVSNVEPSEACFNAQINRAGFYANEGEVAGGAATSQDLCVARSFTANGTTGSTSTQSRIVSTDTYVFGGGARYDSGEAHVDLDLSYVRSDNSNRNIVLDIGKRLDSVDVIVNDDEHNTTNMPGNPLGDAGGYTFVNGVLQDINRSRSTLFATRLDSTFDIESDVLRTMQFGVRYGKRDAEFGAAPLGGLRPPGGDLATPVNSVGLPDDFLVEAPSTIDDVNGGAPWRTPDPVFLREQTGTIREIFGVSPAEPAFDPTRSYDATETTVAAYVQGKYEITLSSSISVDGLIGGRITRTSRDLSGTGLIDGELAPVTRSTADTDFLPNASARIRFGDGLQVRATYARTLSRPFFGDLNPGLSYEVPLNVTFRPNGSAGNPDLLPQKSDAVDATIEYYFGRSSYVSAAAYYRELTNRVGGQVLPEEIGGIVYNITRPRNIGSATLQGLEFSAQIFADFLPEGLDGLGVLGNFTLADSEITTPGDSLEGEPLLGVSKYSYNVGALYEKYGLSARVIYTWRDRYNEFEFGAGLPVPGDRPFFNKVRSNGRLDFSVGYDVTPNLTVTVDGINVLGSSYRSYFDNAAFPRDYRIDDRFFGGSVRLRI